MITPEDHEIVRKGVRDLLEAAPGIRAVGETRTAGSALALTPALRPDVVVVLDVWLPTATGDQFGEGPAMFLTEKTVKNYVSGLFVTLGMERRAQAAAFAAQVFDDQDHSERGYQGD